MVPGVLLLQMETRQMVPVSHCDRNKIMPEIFNAYSTTPIPANQFTATISGWLSVIISMSYHVRNTHSLTGDRDTVKKNSRRMAQEMRGHDSGHTHCKSLLRCTVW